MYRTNLKIYQVGFIIKETRRYAKKNETNYIMYRTNLKTYQVGFNIKGIRTHAKKIKVINRGALSSQVLV